MLNSRFKSFGLVSPVHTMVTLGLALLLISGCQGPQKGQSSAISSSNAATEPSSAYQSTSPSAKSPATNQPLAFIAGQPVTVGAMLPRLISNAGGQTLAEMALDQTLRQRLAQKGLIVSDDMVASERARLLAQLSSDPNLAVRLLKQMEASRGVTPNRLERTLRRNATLRLLSKDEVNVTDQDVRQAYDIQYGTRYEARIITTQTLGQLNLVQAQLAKGASFIDMAIAHSSDDSKAQGGLLSPISPADTTYPAAIRHTLVRLKPGEVSDSVAMNHGYGLVKLERKIAGQKVKFDDVKKELMSNVREQHEQLQMRQLARECLEQADVVVLDPELKASWDRQKAMLTHNP